MSIHLEGASSNAKDNQASTKSITSTQSHFSIERGKKRNKKKQPQEKPPFLIADTQLPDWAAVIAKICENLTEQTLRQKVLFLKWTNFNYLPVDNDRV